MDIKSVLEEVGNLVLKNLKAYIPKYGEPQPLYDSLWDYPTRGGKFFRPTLGFLTCEALGGDPYKGIPAWTAWELLHSSLLVHDDIEDRSKIRRGKPTLHEIYGIPFAINTGDVGYFKCYQILQEGKDLWGLEKYAKVIKLFTDCAVRTGIGQGMEIYQRDYRSPSRATISWYFEMVRHKTSYYTGGGPCATGAILADKNDEEIAYFEKIGRDLALYFQIKDDLINLEMKEEDEKIAPTTKGGGVGKDFAGDIEEGKITLQFTYALNQLKGKERKRYLQLYGKKGITLNEKKEVIEIMRKSGALDYTREFVTIGIKTIEKRIKKKIPESESRKKLLSLVKYYVERTF